MRRLTSLNSPYRFPVTANYVALRQMTVNGVQLRKGDPLPADSPLRKLPRRLEYYIRTRWLTVAESVADVRLPDRMFEAEPRKVKPPTKKPVGSKPAATKKAAKPVQAKKTAANPVKISVKPLTDMTVVELQKKARLLGVADRGTRAQLITRISRSAA